MQPKLQSIHSRISKLCMVAAADSKITRKITMLKDLKRICKIL